MVKVCSASVSQQKQQHYHQQQKIICQMICTSQLVPPKRTFSSLKKLSNVTFLFLPFTKITIVSAISVCIAYYHKDSTCPPKNSIALKSCSEICQNISYRHYNLQLFLLLILCVFCLFFIAFQQYQQYALKIIELPTGH